MINSWEGAEDHDARWQWAERQGRAHQHGADLAGPGKIDWLTDWLIDWLTDWLVVWMNEWMNEWMKLSQHSFSKEIIFEKQKLKLPQHQYL